MENQNLNSTSTLSVLSAYVQRILSEKRLSGYDVEQQSGERIHQSHVNRIKKGEVRNPTFSTLQALALGLGVPEEDVFKAARGIENDIPDFIESSLPNNSKAKKTDHKSFKDKTFRLTHHPTCCVVIARILAAQELPSVRLMAIHHKDGEIFEQTETVEFTYDSLAADYVGDFSEKSARNFADSFAAAIDEHLTIIKKTGAVTVV